MKRISLFSWLTLFVLVLFACNPANNTFINRTYHSTTAQYNGHFNANELLNEAITGYRKNKKEDYYSLLPIELYPDEVDVEGMYSAIDTAISKCSKVIQDHSMPGGARSSAKKEENNTFIDENWTTIGIASYIRRDYDAALKNFKFIKKFYSNDPSNYVGELWMAKTNIALGKMTEAKFNLDALSQAIINEEERNSERFSAENLKKIFVPKKDKPTKIAKIPKEIYLDIYLTKANFSLLKNEKEEAINELITSLHFAKKKEKARVYYILGQLYEESGNRSLAAYNYSKVLKCAPEYDMAFSARLKRALLGGSDKLVKELNKMLVDAKNAEYKDQIYYALAQIELQKKEEQLAMGYLTQSAFYSTSNRRQKGMAYEQMGDLRFAKKDYIAAQKYYDSCALVIPLNYPNAEGIKNKAARLSDLVSAVETAAYEDSVLRISKLSESERVAFIENVIVILNQREADRKRREAEKLAALAKNDNAFNQTVGGNKWYFRNAKTRAEGYDEFRQLWGNDRENEDDWRRSDKIVIATFADPGDSTSQEITSTIGTPEKESLTVEMLMKNIPLTDSALTVSHKRLTKSLYEAGLIYKDQLNELKIASDQFNSVVNRDFSSDYKVMSAFELYKINEKEAPAIASIHSNYILTNYPQSDYAKYLRDPDYFIKKKQLDAKSEEEYIKVVEDYSSGHYYQALMASEKVLTGDNKNPFRAKYLLLKVLCQGQLNEDKAPMLPTLNQVIKEFPNSEEAVKATELLDIIANGYSKNEEIQFGNQSIYKFEDGAIMFVMIFLEADQTSSIAKSKIFDFNREYFSKSNLKVNSKIYGNDQSTIVIDDFETDLDAKEYVRKYQSTRKHLLDLQNAKIISISQENMRILFISRKLKEYEDFFLEYY